MFHFTSVLASYARTRYPSASTSKLPASQPAGGILKRVEGYATNLKFIISINLLL
ncbi:MAG: hypothetical protein PF436_01050 [Prolixibacteraceae bacterium]|jgi:hypothetical protein|nr:hypothetical protein [Prolixibacteraceae bacterium]